MGSMTTAFCRASCVPQSAARNRKRYRNRKKLPDTFGQITARFAWNWFSILRARGLGHRDDGAVSAGG